VKSIYRTLLLALRDLHRNMSAAIEYDNTHFVQRKEK
jgi:hypothetical protein